MSGKKRPTIIQMRQRPYQLDSDRSMMKNLINNEQDSPTKILRDQINKSEAIQSGEERKMNQREINKRKRLQRNRNKQIFDEDFRVQQMSNPYKYLANYAQMSSSINNIFNLNSSGNRQVNRAINPNLNYYNNVNPNDPAMAGCQGCCGQIALCCTSIFSFCCTKCYVYELSTSSAGLVETFGRFTRLLKPGFNRINPCSESVFQVDMKIRIIDTGRNITITRDNIRLTIVTSVAFRVVNPVVVYYILGSQLNRAVQELSIYSFRKIIGQNDLQQILTKKKQLTNQVLDEMNKFGIKGVYFQNIFLEDMLLPPQVQRDLSTLARTKRITQANLIETKADVQSAELMRQTSQLLDTKAAMQIRYLQLVQLIGKQGATLVMDIGAYKGQKTY